MKRTHSKSHLNEASSPNSSTVSTPPSPRPSATLRGSSSELPIPAASITKVQRWENPKTLFDLLPTELLIELDDIWFKSALSCPCCRFNAQGYLDYIALEREYGLEPFVPNTCCMRNEQRFWAARDVFLYGQ